MARQQHDREDLLAEAKALVERASLQLADWDEPVVVGFRRDGSASFYFGGEPVYHFSSNGMLRRAFVDGRIYKAERGRLVALTRRRTADAVELVRHELSEVEAQAFLLDAARRLERLRAALACGEYRLVGQVPEGPDVVARVRAWLAASAGPIALAQSPRAR